MANPWFRLYSEFVSDPKVQLMQENMRYRLVAVLCARCQSSDLSDEVIAYQLRLTPTETQETKSLFVSKGFIDESWNVLKWDKRQWVSDNSTNRVKKFRSKQGETLPKRFNSVSSTVSETDQIQNRTEGSAEISGF